MRKKLRLIAFGDSCTRGEGLPDVWNHDKKITDFRYFNRPWSKMAWPTLLARHLERKVINLGSGGASNREIAYLIHEFEFQPDDIACVLWTFPERHFVYNHPLKGQDNIEDPGLKLLPKDCETKNQQDYWLNWTNLEDRDLDSVMYMKFCHSYLENQCEQVVSMTYVPLCTQEFLLPHCVDIIQPQWGRCFDYAPDGHPGPRTQQAWAMQFLSKIQG